MCIRTRLAELPAMSLSPSQDEDFHKKWSSMYAVAHSVKYRVDSCDARWCLCSEGQCQLLPAACVLQAPSCGVQRMSSLVSVPLSSCVFLLHSPVAFWFVFSFFYSSLVFLGFYFACPFFSRPIVIWTTTSWIRNSDYIQSLEQRTDSFAWTA